MRVYIITLLLFFFHEAVFSQPKKDQLFSLSENEWNYSTSLLRELLAIPNDASYEEHVAQNVDWCTKAFTKLGFDIHLLSTDKVPLLLAERKVKKAKKTVLFYLQIDGQPVDTSHWQQESPYLPVLKQRTANGTWEAIDWKNVTDAYNPEYRVFARSASDAKGPVAMFLTALSIMEKQKWQANYNIKVIMDFEEELGSPHLPGAVVQYKDLLSADMLVILDGPRHITNQPTLTFGARGIATIALTVFGPRVPQHSGHYGNYAPNPALRLSQLLASMKDNQGRVTIPGFYDGITLSDEVKEILRNVPDDEEQIQRSVGIARPDGVAGTYQEALQYPSLNIRGMESAWTGDKVRTIVPDKALAEIDIRLVLENDPEKQIMLVKQHVINQGYHLVEGTPTEEERKTYTHLANFDYTVSYRAYRTDFDSEVGQWLYRSLKRSFEVEPIRQRTSGGSIPISPFVNTLGIPAVTVPTVNRDNNQHSPNENIRMGNYLEGIVTCLGILTEKL